MPDLLQVYDEQTLESFPEDVLHECDTIASLAIEGYIPKSKLPGLANVIGQEKAGLVMEAMEGRDGS